MKNSKHQISLLINEDCLLCEVRTQLRNMLSIVHREQESASAE